MAADGLPSFKKFVSEDDIAAAKQKRQEEWERVRRPDQPEEAPEEVYDPRSLFERLEANRIKKQEEFDEAHRLKNMVKGLENDEIEFLETVSRQKEKEEQDKEMEERLLLAEYKSSLVHDRTVEQEEVIQSVAKKQPPRPLPQKPAKSQKSLLAGVIRKKRSTDSEEVSSKKTRTEATEGSRDDTKKDFVGKTTSEEKTTSEKATLKEKTTLEEQTISKEKITPEKKANSSLVLPGIGDYTDSDSNEDN